MATKSLSIYAVFFVLFLVLLVPSIEAGDECLKEYGGDVGPSFCFPEIFPSFCYQRCRSDKLALGGRCVWRDDDSVICLCDYCSDEPSLGIKPKANAA
ncbi:PREDICTED: defensin-like protein 4 [Tarenaya hassleriana]|uniref:defensin-like protein 4 n=1 Tax=Tarenaya hassleriana TaxID=28532 RepID=UPI00053C4C81|nr:PREDICTED: defensin-like protein 4 [Tarenaya hassleriana]